MSTQDTAALVESVNNLAATVVERIGEIDAHVSDKFVDMDNWKKSAFDSSESLVAVARGSELEIDLTHLSKDMFYPVILSGSGSHFNRYEITRGYSDRSGDGTLSSLFLSFEFVGFTWGGNPASLKIGTCFQTYRSTVGALGYVGYYKPCIFLSGGFSYLAKSNISKLTATIFEEVDFVYHDSNHPEFDISVGPVDLVTAQASVGAIGIDSLSNVDHSIYLSSLGGFPAVGPVEGGGNV